MSYEKRYAFISFLDEKNQVKEGYFELVKFDSHLIQFKTSGNENLISLPTARLLKVKEKEVKEGEREIRSKII